MLKKSRAVSMAAGVKHIIFPKKSKYSTSYFIHILHSSNLLGRRNWQQLVSSCSTQNGYKI